jgi:beta-lactamase class A
LHAPEAKTGIVTSGMASAGSDWLTALASDVGLQRPSIVVGRLDLPDPWHNLNPARATYPASMIKTPLVAACLLEIAAGRFSLNDRIRIDETNMTANDAESPLVPGYEATVDELMRFAIDRSDNVATNQLFDLVGRDRATALAHGLGLERTRFSRKLSGSDPLIHDPEWDGVNRNSHPAGDAALLFAKIDADAFAGAAVLRGYLWAQVWNDKLSLGLSAGDGFAHKTGDTDEVTHDGGILSTPDGKRYVIVAYAEMPSNESNNAAFGRFMHVLRAQL